MSTTAKYIHKPTPIEAEKFDIHKLRFTRWPVDGRSLPMVYPIDCGRVGRWNLPARVGDQGISLQNPVTLEWRPVSEGDYIVVRPTGCIYPMTAEEFERNYAPVSPAPSDHDRGASPMPPPRHRFADHHALVDTPHAMRKW